MTPARLAALRAKWNDAPWSPHESDMRQLLDALERRTALLREAQERIVCSTPGFSPCGRCPNCLQWARIDAELGDGT